MMIKERNTLLINEYRKGNQSARDELININMGLVKTVAKRFVNRGTDYEDLVQIGALGLIKAAKSFNPELGFEFSTYAFSMITGEIRRYLRDDGLIKVSRNIKHSCAQMLKIKEECLKETGKEPPLSFIAERCGINVEDAAFYFGAMSPVESMTNHSDDTVNIENIVGTDNIQIFVENYSLRQAISTLSFAEREIIYYRYTLSMTQSETAENMGITQVKVSRMEKKIMEKLRRQLT